VQLGSEPALRSELNPWRLRAGDWGATGAVTGTTDRFDHVFSEISKSGAGALVENGACVSCSQTGYLWNLDTTELVPFGLGGTKVSVGVDEVVGMAPNVSTYLDVQRAPFAALSAKTPLITPTLMTSNSIDMRFTWANACTGQVAPVCGMTSTGGTVAQAWEDEILCMRSDGIASTVSRFAHHRMSATGNTSGSISQDGRYFLFTSDWEGALGGRADVFLAVLR